MPFKRRTNKFQCEGEHRGCNAALGMVQILVVVAHVLYIKMKTLVIGAKQGPHQKMSAQMQALDCCTSC